MAMVANDPAKAKQMGIPQSVGQEFAQADKGMKFAKAPTTGRPDLQKINNPKTLHGKMSIMKEGGDIMASKMNPGFMAMMAKKKGAQEGSKADMASDKKQMMGMKKMASGGITSAKMGSVKTAAPSRDGIASKGKTKGTMVTMASSTPLGMKKGGMTKKMNMGGKAC
jgi:hypothetical protein